MALRERLRRARRYLSLEKEVKQFLQGFLWLIFAAFIIAIPSFFIGIVPHYYMYVSNGTIGISQSAPSSGTSVEIPLIIDLIAVAVAIFAVFKAVRLFGIRL